MAGNLNLTIIDSSDFISPQPINDNFTALDKLGKEYIVDFGTSGDWWFRKWNSGRAECGIDDRLFGDIPINNPWGGFGPYISNVFQFGAYPFAFSRRPFAKVEYNSGSLQLQVRQENSTSLTLSPSFRFIYEGNHVCNALHAGIFVSGRYK